MHTDDSPNNLFTISTNDFKREACPVCGKATSIIICQDRQKYVGIVEAIDAHAKTMVSRQNILFWRGAFVCAVTWLLIDLFFKFILHSKNDDVWYPLILVVMYGFLYAGFILMWNLADHINIKKQAKKAIEQLIIETGNKKDSLS